MKSAMVILAMLTLMTATATVASAQVMGSATSQSVTVAAKADRDAKLKQLVEATYTLNPWPTRQPPPFEFPDANGQTRSLDRDYKNKVVVLYLFWEG